MELLLVAPDPAGQKRGMQTLCKLYRMGFRLRNPQRIVTFLIGLLHHEDDKVRRWSLNSLALLGTGREVQAVLEAIERNRLDPDILGAGIAALTALVDEDIARRHLADSDLPLEGQVLFAAAQQSEGFETELRKARVNIERAEPPELRQVNVLIGLNRAPENIFTLKHPNRRVIGQLNKHPDRIVAQYSVWATHENPKMDISDLGIRVKDTDSQPPNVRKYIYRIASADAQTASRNHELVVEGSQDVSVEARDGLAAGLRDVFYDGLEELILDWFANEPNEEVRLKLLEHMAANAVRFMGYHEPVLRAYEAAASTSLVRARLEAACRGSDMLLRMKRIAFEADRADLFAQSVSMRSKSISRLKRVDRQSSSKDIGAAAKILIVTALPKEAAAVKATLTDIRTQGEQQDPNIYEIGVYRNRNGTGHDRAVILATSGMGKQNASTLAANALRTFPQIEHIVMVGIAGGCPNPTKPAEHVRLGDVVSVSQAGIIEYDYVKETDKGRDIRGSLQKPSYSLLSVANSLQSNELLGVRPWEDMAVLAVKKLGRAYVRPNATADVLHGGRGVIDHPQDNFRRKGKPRVHSGAIASADTLQKRPKARDELRDRFGVRAIEMEASGIQNAAWAQGKDVFVVRGICDYCDDFKNDIWQNYAALMAACYAQALIEAMPEDWFK